MSKKEVKKLYISEILSKHPGAKREIDRIVEKINELIEKIDEIETESTDFTEEEISILEQIVRERKEEEEIREEMERNHGRKNNYFKEFSPEEKAKIRRLLEIIGE